MWLPQMRVLNDEFRVLSLDLRGHGARRRVAFDFDGCVDDVESTVAKLGIDPVMFVGSSLGGCVAVEIAQRSPHLVAGLVLAGSSFDPTTPLCRLVLTGESIVFPKIEPRLVRQYQEYIRRTIDPHMADEILGAGCYWGAAADAVKQMRGRDFVGALRSYDGPTLIVNGSRDWVHRFYERRFLNASQNGSVIVINGANHICSLDAPDVFADAVRAFADKCAFPLPEPLCE
jgi:pimeloyl-ACP methyl ester carboxylesterase